VFGADFHEPRAHGEAGAGHCRARSVEAIAVGDRTLAPVADRADAARMDRTPLVSEQDVEYWRELAAQYQRELEALRARVLRYLDAPQPENAAALLCAAKALPGWMEELDRIAPE